MKTYEAGQGINTSEQRRQFLKDRCWSAEDSVSRHQERGRGSAAKGSARKWSCALASKLIVIRFTTPCYGYAMETWPSSCTSGCRKGKLASRNWPPPIPKAMSATTAGASGLFPSQAHPQVAENYASANRANLAALLFGEHLANPALDTCRGPAWMKTPDELPQELFNDWLHQRMRLLEGEQPDPLPLHLLGSQLSSDLA